MSRRIPGSGSLGRAKTPEDKALVRQAFINAGRRLLAQEPASQVSLRRIAGEAGYSPASIYQYFADSRALFVAIRENDMSAAADFFERVASSTTDPVERVRQVSKQSINYWLSRPEEFDFLFSMAGKHVAPTREGEVPFGQTPVAMRALNVYFHAIDALFKTLPAPPMPSRLAADTLFAAIYGVVLVPRATPTKRWSDIYRMAELTIDALVDSWLAGSASASDRNATPDKATPRKRR